VNTVPSTLEVVLVRALLVPQGGMLVLPLLVAEETVRRSH
jgi:hypothetical protein